MLSRAINDQQHPSFFLGGGAGLVLSSFIFCYDFFETSTGFYIFF